MTVNLSTPTVVEREGRRYVGIRAVVTMATIDAVIPELIRELFASPQIVAVGAGAPIVRYDVIDMERELAIQVGVPTHAEVTAEMPGDGRLVGGVLPAGRYLTATHTGPYDRLEEATGAFRTWASQHGHTFDMRLVDRDEVWGCRLEHYPTDPTAQPDSNRWETILEFRLQD